MDLLWPGFLVLLVLIPILIGVYLWILRRRKVGIRYSSLSLVREALPRYSRIRRHLPFALLLLALASLIIALVRPVAIVSIPTDQTTIILTMDVSRSMLFNDVPPNRLSAAEDAATNFIQNQRATTQIGLVAFSGFAELIQPPTTDQQSLQAAVDSLTTGRATAIGAGILKALDAIAEIDPSVQASVTDTSTEPTPVPKGAYAPDIIVLLTDGVSNAGPLPMDAAQQAADRGVRVYTISFGTEAGPTNFGGGGGQFGGGGGGQFGGGGGFGGFRRGIDDVTLKQIAELTGGDYYTATTADELQKVFQSLPTYLITKHETSEISVVFVAIGALFAAAAVLLSLMWHPLP